jgi:hypothetical protein
VIVPGRTVPEQWRQTASLFDATAHLTQTLAEDARHVTCLTYQALCVTDTQDVLGALAHQQVAAELAALGSPTGRILTDGDHATRVRSARRSLTARAARGEIADLEVAQLLSPAAVARLTAYVTLTAFCEPTLDEQATLRLQDGALARLVEDVLLFSALAAGGATSGADLSFIAWLTTRLARRLTGPDGADEVLSWPRAFARWPAQLTAAARIVRSQGLPADAPVEEALCEAPTSDDWRTASGDWVVGSLRRAGTPQAEAMVDAVTVHLKRSRRTTPSCATASRRPPASSSASASSSARAGGTGSSPRSSRGRAPERQPLSSPSKRSCRRSTNVTCARTRRVRASPGSHQATRSISGNSCCLPDRGGHSARYVLLTTVAGSASPRTAHAMTCLPEDWRTAPSGMSSPSGTGSPVSSVNSRRAAASGSSSEGS